MISIPIKTEAEVPLSVAKALRELSRRSVDGTVDIALKHKQVNQADSSAIASTASETAFSTVATISESLYGLGRVFRLTASGVFSTTGTPTIQFRVRIGTTNIVVFTAQTCPNNSANQPFLLEAEIVVKTLGATGTVSGQGRLFFSTSTLELIVNATDTTVDTTSEQTVNVTAQWSASSASNTVKIRNFFPELSDY